MNLYSLMVKDYCFQRRLSYADADDIVQEVMRKVSSAIQSFEYDPSLGRFRASLETVAANTIKTHLAAAIVATITMTATGDGGEGIGSSVQSENVLWQ